MRSTTILKIVMYLVFWITFPVTLVEAAPPIPENLKIESILTHYISFSWSISNSSGISSYEVKRIDSPNNEHFFYSDNEFYLDTALQPDVTYHYKVRSVDSSGSTSGWSNELTIATKKLNQHTPNPAFSSLNTNEAIIIGTYAETCHGFDGSKSTDDPDKIICTLNMTNYSGFNYDPINHQILMLGAGRVAFFNDAVVSFNLDSLVWQELYRPTPCGWLTVSNFDEERRAWMEGPQGPYPRPVSRHSYEGGIFVTVNGQNRMYYMRNGGLIGYGGSFSDNCVEQLSQELQIGNGKIAYYDFSSNDWIYTDMGFSIECCWMRHPSHEFDPVSEKMISVSSSGMWIADLANETRTKVRGYPWVDNTGNPITSLATGTELIYHPPSDSFFLFNRENGQHIVYELELDRNDFSNSTLTKIQNTGQNPPADLINTDGPGFAWDSLNDIIGGAVTNGIFYVFDPYSRTWSSEIIDVLNISFYDVNLNQAYYAIAYDPIDNVFIFQTRFSQSSRWNSHVIAYRYQGDNNTPSPLQAELTVIANVGGTVTSQPQGINCGIQCTEAYDKGSSIILTAQPDSGFTFSSWNGPGCSNTSNTCTVILDADTQVTASFSPITNTTEIIVDNKDTNTFSTGSWSVSGGANPYAGESLYAGYGGIFRWLPNITEPGTYEVYAWWTYFSSRSSNVPFLINHVSGLSEIFVDQRDSGLGGQWNLLGTFLFGSGANAYIEVSSKNGQTSADAIRLVKTNDSNPLPQTVELVVISGGGTVTSQPQGINCGMQCTQTYEKGSSVTLTAQADSGFAFSSWSGPGCSNSSNTCTVILDADIQVTASFSPIANTTEIIVDNKDTNTLSTGSWSVSGGANPYAGESLYSANGGTYRWLLDITEPGSYEVYAWWTYFSSRSSNVPYRIQHNSGVSEVFVNQRDAGLPGQWNLLGTFLFGSGADAYIEVSSENGQASADAIRLIKN